MRQNYTHFCPISQTRLKSNPIGAWAFITRKKTCTDILKCVLYMIFKVGRDRSSLCVKNTVRILQNYTHIRCIPYLGPLYLLKYLRLSCTTLTASFLLQFFLLPEASSLIKGICFASDSHPLFSVEDIKKHGKTPMW